MLLNELFWEYVEDIEIDIKDTTLDSIKYRYTNRIENQLGYLEIKDITYTVLKKYQKQLLEKEFLSVVYINMIIGLIKRVMKYGYLHKKIDIYELDLLKDLQDNKKIIDKQITWSLEEFNNFITNVDEENYKILFNILFFCGFRKGEVLSLKWNNVDFEERCITINSTAVKVIGKGQIVTSPKTKQANRIIYLNDTLYEMLLEYYFEMKQQYQVIDNYYIVSSYKMISLSTLDRQFIKYRDMSNNSKMNLHGFRHSHASMLITLTSDLQAISVRLGHANVEETMNTYLHSNNANQRALAKVVEDKIQVSNECNSMRSTINVIKKILLKELNDNIHTQEENQQLINTYQFINNNIKIGNKVLANI